MNIYNNLGNSTAITSSENPRLSSQLDIHLDGLSKCRNVTELCTALLDVTANFLSWAQTEQKLYIEKAFSVASKFNPEESLVTMQMMTRLTTRVMLDTPGMPQDIFREITPYELRALPMALSDDTVCEKCIELVKKEFFTANLGRQLQLIDALMFYAGNRETQALKVGEQLADKVHGDNWETLVLRVGSRFPPLIEHGTDIRPIFDCSEVVRSTTHNPLESYLSLFNYVTETVPREQLSPAERKHIASQVLNVLWEGGQDLQLVKNGLKASAYANVWPEVQQLAEEFTKKKTLSLPSHVEICGQKFKNKRIHPNTAEYKAVKDSIGANIKRDWATLENSSEMLIDRPGDLINRYQTTRKFSAKEFAYICYDAWMEQKGFEGSFKEYIDFMKSDNFRLEKYTDAKWADIDRFLKFT